jgi:hypothetical protein
MDCDSTATIQKELGIPQHDELQRARVLRILVFECLHPITDLEGEAFVRAWLDCIRCKCHFLLLSTQSN